MRHFTVLLALGKDGSVLHRLDCLPHHEVAPGISAGSCAGPDCYTARHRAALELLSAARRRRDPGVAGYAVVSASTLAQGLRLVASYCFKVPRVSVVASGGTPSFVTWDALFGHLSLVSPAARKRARPRRRRRA